MIFFFVVFAVHVLIMESSSGLKKDGSVKCNEETDYCLEFMRHFSWNTNVQRSTSQFPWITPEEFQDSYTYKYLNYEMEDGYINPDDPLHTGESLRDLRRDETRLQSLQSKRKRTANAKESDFQTIAQSVKEVKGGNQDVAEDDEEDVFLDEYGNVIESDALSADKDLSAKAKALMNENNAVESAEKPTTKVQKQQQQHDYPKHTWKDLDDVRDVRHAINQEPKKPMFKSHYIEPKESVLSHSDQKTYLRLMQRFRNPGESSIVGSMEDFNLYQCFRDLVTQEQVEYQAFAKDLICKDAHKKNDVITPAARRYAEEKLQCQLDRVQKLPRSYVGLNQSIGNDSMVRMLPMVNEQQDSLPQFEMRMQENLLELGSIPKIVIPPAKRILNSNYPLRLENNYQKIASRYVHYQV